MECIRCGEQMESSVTTYTDERGDSIIIVRHVPCYKCENCGEVSYSMSVVKRLEDITKQLEKAFTEIAVVNYTAV